MANEQCKWCENKAVSRGVCAKHYARCAVLVSDGATWEAVLAGDEPQPGKRGRPMKTGSASWLAEKYDQLAADVIKAIALIELGNTDEAKRVLMGEAENQRKTAEMSDSVANVTRRRARQEARGLWRMDTRWKAGELIMKPKLTELTSERDAFLLAKGLAE